MKKLLLILTAISFSFSANAGEIKKFFSIEYVAPEVYGSGVNTRFQSSKNIFEQAYNLENLALGANFRINKNWGINLNAARVEMENNSLVQARFLSRKANLKVENYNVSALYYYPVINDSFEIFAEGGASKIHSKLSYIDAAGNAFSDKENETKLFYGAGFQFKFDEKNIFRFSAQKYAGNLGSAAVNYTNIRLGYLRAF
jgi:hypothetical protein